MENYDDKSNTKNNLGNICDNNQLFQTFGQKNISAQTTIINTSNPFFPNSNSIFEQKSYTISNTNNNETKYNASNYNDKSNQNIFMTFKNKDKDGQENDNINNEYENRENSNEDKNENNEKRPQTLNEMIKQGDAFNINSQKKDNSQNPFFSSVISTNPFTPPNQCQQNKNISPFDSN